MSNWFVILLKKASTLTKLKYLGHLFFLLERAAFFSTLCAVKINGNLQETSLV